VACGVDKRRVLERAVLPAMGAHRDLQRLVAEYADALEEMRQDQGGAR
jgi:hypothetical protein